MSIDTGKIRTLEIQQLNTVVINLKKGNETIPFEFVPDDPTFLGNIVKIGKQIGMTGRAFKDLEEISEAIDSEYNNDISIDDIEATEAVIDKGLKSLSSSFELANATFGEDVVEFVTCGIKNQIRLIPLLNVITEECQEYLSNYGEHISSFMPPNRESRRNKK